MAVDRLSDLNLGILRALVRVLLCYGALEIVSVIIIIIMGVIIKAENHWSGIGWPQVAVCRICHIL